MRQLAQSYRTGVLELLQVAPPRAPAGGLLVETRASLISAGTERSIVELARKSLLEKARERPDLVAKVLEKAKREGVLAALDAVRSKLDSPIPLGYSLAGTVLQVGSGLEEFRVGDRVACAGAGYANHAELNAVPRNLAVHVPEGVSDEEASFVTVGAIALHGVRLVRPALGEVIAVVGLGLLGQLAVQLLRAQGCDVLGFDIDPDKVTRALARGAIGGAVVGRDDPVELVRAHTRGRGVDGVVLTASSPDARPLALAAEIARDRAVVSVVGLMPLELPRKPYFEKELEVVVSRSYGPGRYDPSYEERGQDYPIGYVRWTERRNLEAVLGAIASGRLDVKSLITHRFEFERALDAYALVTGERPEPHLGVVLTYPTPAVVPPPPTAATSAGKAGALQVAMVGTGSFANSVLLPALVRCAGVQVTHAVSGRGLSARHAAQKFGIPHVASSLEEVLERPEVDLIFLATRHGLHAGQAAAALRAGKDVFLEKPAAVDREGLELLGAALRTSGRRLCVGYNRRAAPFAERVRAHFEGRQTGLLMTARISAGRLPPAHWTLDPTEGGGRLVGEACHFIDLMSSWAGAPVCAVAAEGLGGTGAHSYRDNAMLTLRFADGSVGQLLYTSMGDASLGKERYEVFCEGKVAVLEDWRTLTLTSMGKSRTHRALRADKGHRALLEAFVRACREGRPSPLAWEDIEATTRATFAAEACLRGEAP